MGLLKVKMLVGGTDEVEWGSVGAVGWVVSRSFIKFNGDGGHNLHLEYAFVQ